VSLFFALLNGLRRHISLLCYRIKYRRPLEKVRDTIIKIGFFKFKVRQIRHGISWGSVQQVYLREQQFLTRPHGTPQSSSFLDFGIAFSFLGGALGTSVSKSRRR